MKVKHPVQPIEEDANGHLRFKENKIVRFLLDAGPFDMNQLACMEYSSEDREQFAQLIGYSLGGFGELSYVSEETYGTASTMAESGKDEKDARIDVLESMVTVVRKAIKEIAPAIFKIHPDDLEE